MVFSLSTWAVDVRWRKTLWDLLDAPCGPDSAIYRQYGRSLAVFPGYVGGEVSKLEVSLGFYRTGSDRSRERGDDADTVRLC